MKNQSVFQVYNASAGSGKTFTLVKEYLKILLQSNDDPFLFQKILAITFTNKAAAEMKERVLSNLLEFSKPDTMLKPNDMFEMIVEETGIEAVTIQKQSKIILQNILQNYSAFHIRTIDSFTNKLIKSFAFDLGLPMDFEVELDGQSILRETVDVIISKIGIDKELTDILVEFARQKTLEDKSWDISRELNEISVLLLNENDVKEIQRLEDKSISDFKSLEKKLRKNQRITEKEFKKIGEKGLEIIAAQNIDHKDFYYRGDLPNFFKKLLNIKPLGPRNFKVDGRLNKALEEEILYGKKAPEDVKARIDNIKEDLIQVYDDAKYLYEIQYSTYILNDLILKNLIPLAIINTINKVLEEIKIENNIRLNSEFNQIISKYLREQPVAFIFEKIGEKYRHYFIDEMQDTSVLQWENLIPLIDNVLSAENSSLMLVGDAKQAIYRWRGGKAEQFIDLSAEKDSRSDGLFQIEKKLESLDTNYRSFSEIINFNNQFFTHISKYFLKDSYRDLYKDANKQKKHKKGCGYVEIDFVEECKNKEERDQIFPVKVYETILKLEDRFDKNEICVLVRKKDQGIAIANTLTKNGIQIVSSETLLLKNNYKVDFIIHLLSYLKDENNDEAKINILYYLYDHRNIKLDRHEFISSFIKLDTKEFFKALEEFQLYFNPQLFNHSPFYESIEEIIRAFKLTRESDAYLQFFLDFVFDFTQRVSQNNIEFLDFWEQKKEKLSIVAANNKDAVQIMTIHKSKGLEFPVVIFPYDLDIYDQIKPKSWYRDLDEEKYNNFSSILINSSSVIENTGPYGKELFKQQQEELELDNFNLLYVALTRPKEQLFIISEKRKTKGKLRFYSHFFIDFLKNSTLWEEGKLIYKFGDRKRISKRESDDLKTEIQTEFISSSWQEHQINIVSNSDLLGDTERGEAVQFGNMIHELMAGIITKEDIERAVDQFVNKGMLPKNRQDKIKELIGEIVDHQQLKPYFQRDKIVYTEREILTMDKQVLIPDRLVLDEHHKMTIIDYKTGKQEEVHRSQIENYAKVLQKMGFVILEKLLVYIDKHITVIPVGSRK